MKNFTHVLSFSNFLADKTMSSCEKTLALLLPVYKPINNINFKKANRTFTSQTGPFLALT